MANTKLTDLTALTAATAADDDVIYVGDVSAGASGSKKMTLKDLREFERLTRNPQTIFVNDFYPPAVTASRDGETHPLSAFYGSLAAAEADFPHLDFTAWSVTLADEVDWVALQSAADYCYFQNPHLADYPNEWAVWKVKLDGNYVVNRGVRFTTYSVLLEGTAYPSRFSHSGVTSITYNGPEGTDTDKVFVVDHWALDSEGVTYDSRKPTVSPIFQMKYMGINGIGDWDANLIDITQSPADSGVGFVVGLRIRDAQFVDVSNCSFSGNLMDGIWVEAGMWTRISFNHFYGIYRDCISVMHVYDSSNFCTTQWIDDNEFGAHGRYAILLNHNGAIEPSPSIRRNSLEGVLTNCYYSTHAEEWVQGLRSTICQIGGTFGNYFENRAEGTLIQSALSGGVPMWADLHLVGCSNTGLTNNRLLGIIFSCFKASQRFTTAYQTFKDTYKYVDINAERNFNAPTAASYVGPCGANVIDNYVNGDCVANIAGVSMDASNSNSFSNGGAFCVNVDTFEGTYITQARPPGHASATMGELSGARLFNFLDNTNLFGPIDAANYDNGAQQGTYSVGSSGNTYGTWTANTAYVAELQASFPGLSAGDGLKSEKWIYPTVHNGCIYECTVSGTSGSSEPTWPTTRGNTVVDGTITWKCVRVQAMYYEVGSRFENMLVTGRRHIRRSAIPTTGKYNEGTVVWIQGPTYSTTATSPAWVCVTAGNPGTWIPLSGNYGHQALASLPAAATANRGCRAMVSDSNATLAAGIGNTVASGGANIVPVYSDGTNWKIG